MEGPPPDYGADPAVCETVGWTEKMGWSDENKRHIQA